MLRAPSCRKRQVQDQKLNLIPILDSVFIFIFFLLVSANFIKIYEISSDVPILSASSPPSKKKPLALTLRIELSQITLHTGVPGRKIKTFRRNAQGYPLEDLHDYLVALKQKHRFERSIIFEPKFNLTYEEIIQVMDAVRTLRKTDPSFYTKNEERHFHLFDKIVFGNIQDLT